MRDALSQLEKPPYQDLLFGKTIDAITENEKDEEHLLLVVIAGNAPKAEFTDLAYKRISEFENKSD